MSLIRGALFGILAIVVAGMGAQAQTATVRVKSGQTVQIRAVFSCEFHTFEVWPTGAQHGTVTLRKYTAPKCYKQNVPHIGVLYTSNAGYKGFDQVWIPSSGGSRTQVRIYVE